MIISTRYVSVIFALFTFLSVVLASPMEQPHNDDGSFNELPGNVLANIMEHLPSAKDIANAMLVNKEMSDAGKSAPNFFFYRHGAKSIDELYAHLHDIPPVFPNLVIKQMPVDMIKMLLNRYAGRCNWDKVRFMTINGADPSLLAYSMVCAKRHEWGISNWVISNLRKIGVEDLELPQINIHTLNEIFKTLLMDELDIIATKHQIRFPIRANPTAEMLDKLLFIASKWNLPAAVELLISYGADVNYKVSEGADAYTILGIAVASKNLEVVNHLLKAGANVETVRTELDQGTNEEFLHTPLRMAMREEGNEGIMRRLLEAGADVDRKDYYGYFPLHFAAELNELKYVKLLLKAGADMNAQYDRGRTPLHFAVESDSADSLPIIKELINAEAKIRYLDYEGKSRDLLEYAKHLKNIPQNSPETVRLMKKRSNY